MNRYYIVMISFILAGQAVADIRGEIKEGGTGIPGIQVDAYKFDTKSGILQYYSSANSGLGGVYLISTLDAGQYMLVANPAAQSNSNQLFSNAWSEHGPFWNKSDNLHAKYPVMTYNNVCSDPACGSTPTFINHIPPTPTTNINFNFPSSKVCTVNSIVINGEEYEKFCNDSSPEPDPLCKGFPNSPNRKFTVAYALEDRPTTNPISAQARIFATNPDTGQQMVIPVGTTLEIKPTDPNPITQTLTIPKGIWDGAMRTSPPHESGEWVLNIGVQFVEANASKTRSVCNPILFPVANP